MRRLLRNVFLNTAGLFSKPKNGIHIINAHFLNIETKKKDEDHFIDQLNVIGKNAQLIKFDEALNLINDRKKVNEALVAFTFDDGFEECHSLIAPILESFKINAGFFINPNFVECDQSYYAAFSKRVSVHQKKPMDWQQIKNLHERGHIIGAHTMDHIDLGKMDLSLSDLTFQLKNCKQVIEDRIGNICNTFAFPYGRISNLSDEALSLAEDVYDFILSGTDYTNYYSFKGRVINRRHIEPYWPVNHVNYFLGVNKKF